MEVPQFQDRRRFFAGISSRNPVVDAERICASRPDPQNSPCSRCGGFVYVALAEIGRKGVVHEEWACLSCGDAVRFHATGGASSVAGTGVTCLWASCP